MEHLPMHLSASKIMTCVCVLCRICKRFGFTCIAYGLFLDWFFLCFAYPMDDTTHYSLSAIGQIKAFRVFAQNDDPIEPIFICVKCTFLFADQIGFWIHWHVYSMHRWHGKHAISIKTCWNACLFILMLNVHVNLFT